MPAGACVGLAPGSETTLREAGDGSARALQESNGVVYGAARIGSRGVLGLALVRNWMHAAPYVLDHVDWRTDDDDTESRVTDLWLP